MAATAEATAVPSGRTADLMRLTYPAKWRSEAAAQRFARDNHLTSAGVTVVPVDGVWHIVIDTDRAAMITPWLRAQFPGILWSVGWAPKP